MESNLSNFLDKKVRDLTSKIYNMKKTNKLKKSYSPKNVMTFHPGFRCQHKYKYYENFSYYEISGTTFPCLTCFKDSEIGKIKKIYKQTCGFCGLEFKRKENENNCYYCRRDLCLDSENFGKIDVNMRNSSKENDNSSNKNFKKIKKYLCLHKNEWFASTYFSCCNHNYPCQICHDNKSDHIAIIQNYCCGYCEKNIEIFNKNMKSHRNLSCGKNLSINKGSFWEGGKGCIEKEKMNCNCPKKYTGLNKTTANKTTSNFNLHQKDI